MRGVKHNLVGRAFGLLTVEREATSNRGSRWFCRCACGGTKVVAAASLLSGTTRSCGCLQKGRPPSQSVAVGDKRNRLTVVAYVRMAPEKGRIWLVQCECGRKREASTGALNAGHVKSCGQCGYGRGYREGRRQPVRLGRRPIVLKLKDLLRHAGKPQAAIAAALRVSEPTVRRNLRRLGLLAVPASRGEVARALLGRGAPVRRVVAETGLTRQRVYQIRAEMR